MGPPAAAAAAGRSSRSAGPPSWAPRVAAAVKSKDHIAAAMRWPRPHASPARPWHTSYVQHLQLRLGLRRVLLHALDGWTAGGAGCWSSRVNR